MYCCSPGLSAGRIVDLPLCITHVGWLPKIEFLRISLLGSQPTFAQGTGRNGASNYIKLYVVTRISDHMSLVQRVVILLNEESFQGALTPWKQKLVNVILSHCAVIAFSQLCHLHHS